MKNNNSGYPFETFEEFDSWTKTVPKPRRRPLGFGLCHRCIRYRLFCGVEWSGDWQGGWGFVCKKCSSTKLGLRWAWGFNRAIRASYDEK